MATKSLEKMIQRALDILEIQNVMGRHMYYHNAGKHSEELEAIWAQKTPGVSFWQDNGYVVGMESIKKSYVEYHAKRAKRNLDLVRKLYPDVEDKPENYGIGTMVVHPLTTPVIEVAGDGKTAKGVWYSPGQVTDLGPDGKPTALWMWEKYGVDFVKEDSEWKIWHIHMYMDFVAPVGESWVDLTQDEELVNLGRVEDRPKPDLAEPNTYQGYGPKTVPQMMPIPPEPYETFDETFSYGP